MNHTHHFGVLTESSLREMIVGVPMHQAQNTLLQIKYDSMFRDGWYGDTSAEIAALAVRWLDQIHDMNEMEFAAWIDGLLSFGAFVPEWNLVATR